MIRNLIWPNAPGIIVPETREELMFRLIRALHLHLQMKGFKAYEYPLHILEHELRNNITALLLTAYNSIGTEDKIRMDSPFFIRTRRQLGRHTDGVSIECTDQGSGIYREYLPRIFDEDFTTKIVTGGQGIGLSYVKEIILPAMTGWGLLLFLLSLGVAAGMVSFGDPEERRRIESRVKAFINAIKDEEIERVRAIWIRLAGHPNRDLVEEILFENLATDTDPHYGILRILEGIDPSLSAVMGERFIRLYYITRDTLGKLGIGESFVFNGSTLRLLYRLVAADPTFRSYEISLEQFFLNVPRPASDSRRLLLDLTENYHFSTTSLFRYPQQAKILEDIISELLTEQMRQGIEPLTIVVAGSSTGEEAITLCLAAASKLKEEFGQRAVNIEDRLKVIGMEIYQKRVDTAIDILEEDAFPRLAVGDLISFILNHGLDHLPRVILKELERDLREEGIGVFTQSIQEYIKLKGAGDKTDRGRVEDNREELELALTFFLQAVIPGLVQNNLPYLHRVIDYVNTSVISPEAVKILHDPNVRVVTFNNVSQYMPAESLKHFGRIIQQLRAGTYFFTDLSRYFMVRTLGLDFSEFEEIPGTRTVIRKIHKFSDRNPIEDSSAHLDQPLRLEAVAGWWVLAAGVAWKLIAIVGTGVVLMMEIGNSRGAAGIGGGQRGEFWGLNSLSDDLMQTSEGKRKRDQNYVTLIKSGRKLYHQGYSRSRMSFLRLLVTQYQGRKFLEDGEDLVIIVFAARDQRVQWPVQFPVEKVWETSLEFLSWFKNNTMEKGCQTGIFCVPGWGLTFGDLTLRRQPPPAVISFSMRRNKRNGSFGVPEGDIEFTKYILAPEEIDSEVFGKGDRGFKFFRSDLDRESKDIDFDRAPLADCDRNRLSFFIINSQPNSLADAEDREPRAGVDVRGDDAFAFVALNLNGNYRGMKFSVGSVREDEWLRLHALEGNMKERGEIFWFWNGHPGRNGPRVSRVSAAFEFGDVGADERLALSNDDVLARIMIDQPLKMGLDPRVVFELAEFWLGRFLGNVLSHGSEYTINPDEAQENILGILGGDVLMWIGIAFFVAMATSEGSDKPREVLQILTRKTEMLINSFWTNFAQGNSALIERMTQQFAESGFIVHIGTSSEKRLLILPAVAAVVVYLLGSLAVCLIVVIGRYLIFLGEHYIWTRLTGVGAYGRKILLSQESNRIPLRFWVILRTGFLLFLISVIHCIRIAVFGLKTYEADMILADRPPFDDRGELGDFWAQDKKPVSEDYLIQADERFYVMWMDTRLWGNVVLIGKEGVEVYAKDGRLRWQKKYFKHQQAQKSVKAILNLPVLREEILRAKKELYEEDPSVENSALSLGALVWRVPELYQGEVEDRKVRAKRQYEKLVLGILPVGGWGIFLMLGLGMIVVLLSGTLDPALAIEAVLTLSVPNINSNWLFVLAFLVVGMAESLSQGDDADSFEEEIGWLNSRGLVTFDLFQKLSKSTLRRLIEMAAEKTVSVPFLTRSQIVSTTLDILLNQTLSFIPHHYQKIAKSQAWKGNLIDFIRNDLGLNRLATLEETIQINQKFSLIYWDKVSDEVMKRLVKMVMIKMGKLDWRPSARKITRTPLEELNGRGLGSDFLDYWRKRKPDDFQGTTLEFILAELGILGEQYYEGSHIASPTAWQRLQRIVEILNARRIYVDLDETLFWPGGWVGSEDWISARGRESKKVFHELADYENRITRNGYMMATDPRAVAVIQHFRDQGIQVIGITARSATSRKRVEATLRGLGLELEVIYLGSHARDAKAQRVAQENVSRGQARCVLVDNLNDNLYALEVLRVPETTGVLFEANRHDRWKDPWFYVERARSFLSLRHPERSEGSHPINHRMGFFVADAPQNDSVFAQEDLVNALELSSRLSPPNVSVGGPDTSTPGFPTKAFGNDSLLERVNLYYQISLLIDPLRAGPVDCTAFYQSYLQAAADLLYDFSRGPPPVAVSTETFSLFLEKFFPCYFPANGSHMAQYYQDGLIKLRKTTNNSNETNYEFVIDETNLYVYLEPTLQQILQQSLSGTLDKVIVIDSGARPIFWAIQAFVRECDLNVDVILLPLSVKTNGDTLKTTQHWMKLARAFHEEISRHSERSEESLLDEILRRYAPQNDDDFAKQVAEVFAKLFPLAGQSVMIVDDNMTTGETLEIAQRILATEGVKDLSICVLWAYRDGKIRKDEVCCAYHVPGNFSWQFPMPVGMTMSWESDLSLRGIKERRLLDGNPIPQELTPQDREFGRFERFRNTLLETFKTHLEVYGEHLLSPVSLRGGAVSDDEAISLNSKKIASSLKSAPRNDTNGQGNISDFTLNVDGNELLFRVVRSPEAPEEYINREDHRPMDVYGDQLLYADLTFYRIYDENNGAVGVLEMVAGRLMNLKETAWVLEYVDLDYECAVAIDLFVDSLKRKLSELAHEKEITWLLMPAQMLIVSGRPEIMRALRESRMPSVYDRIHLNESLRRSTRDAAWLENVKTRLALLFTGRMLADTIGDEAQRYREGLEELEAAGNLPSGWLGLLRFRFRSLSRGRFRVLWREGMEVEQALPEPSEEWRPYLFDANEYETAAMIQRAQEWKLGLNKTQREFLERL